MTEISDADLDRRLKTAGTMLDDLATSSAGSTLTELRAQRRRPRIRYPDLGRPPRLIIAATIAAFAVLAVGAAVVLRSDPTEDRTPSVSAGPTTTHPDRRPARDAVRAVSFEELRGLGLTGLLVATDTGLIDLTRGRATPMLSPADPLGTSAPTALPDGTGGILYITPQLVESRIAGGSAETGVPYGWPELRHLTDGRDTLVEAGVTSVALRADGTQARAVGTDPALRGNLRFHTDIVVVAPDGTRTTWSTGPADQQVVAWAGDHLLIEKGIPDSEARTLHVLDGPGRERELSPQGGLVAVGPDGSWVLVAGLEPGQEPLHDEPRPSVPPRLIDVSSGEVRGSVVLDEDHSTVGLLSWSGDDRLVGLGWRASGEDDGMNASDLIEADVQELPDGTVNVVQERAVPFDRSQVHIPTDVWSSANGTITALATSSDGRYRQRLVICPPDEDRCELVEPPFGHTGQVSHVVNPSRPLPSP